MCVLWWQTRALSAQIIFPVEIYFWRVIYQSRAIYKHKNNAGSYGKKKVNVMLELIIFLFYITCALWFCCSPHKSEKQANKRPKRQKKKSRVCCSAHVLIYYLHLVIFNHLWFCLVCLKLTICFHWEYIFLSTKVFWIFPAKRKPWVRIRTSQEDYTPHLPRERLGSPRKSFGRRVSVLLNLLQNDPDMQWKMDGWGMHQLQVNVKV